MKLIKKGKGGFTLTELIIVIVIIGILAAVLIPSLSGYINKTKKSAAEQEAASIRLEFLEKAPSDDYADFAEARFIVQHKGYYVLIDKGAVQDSFLQNDQSTYTVTTGVGSEVSLSEINATNMYIFLNENTNYIPATSSGKIANVILYTVIKK